MCCGLGLPWSNAHSDPADGLLLSPRPLPEEDWSAEPTSSPRRAFMFDNLGPSHPSIPKAFVPFEHFDLLQDATLTADLTAFSGFTHGCLLSTFLTTLEEGASTCPGVLIFQGSRDMNTQAGSQWRILVAWFRTGRWAEPTAIFSPTTSCLVYETPS